MYVPTRLFMQMERSLFYLERFRRSSRLHKIRAAAARLPDNFVSLGVSGSGKYVIKLVMFGGLVSFSYCPRFVLITAAPPPPTARMTA